jgi:hypothetical protein
MMKNQHNTPRNRRDILKLTGMGAGAFAFGTLGASKAQANGDTNAITQSSWIHGNNMQIEYPDNLSYIRHLGSCTQIKGHLGLTNWFHFSIPTPVYLLGSGVKAKAVMLRFETYSIDAWIRDVHVYDAEERIATFDELNLSEEQLDTKVELVDEPTIYYGLNIAIGVSFGVDATMSHEMRFYAAGCDFI